MKDIKSRDVHFVGGAKVGFATASFPLAILFANTSKITLYFGLDTYKLSPHQVASLAVKQNGISIRHTIQSYPSEIFFGGFGDAQKIYGKIYSTGFLPHGRLEDVVNKKSTPFCKAALEISILICIAITIVIFISLSSESVIDRRNYITGILKTLTLLILLIQLLAIRFIAGLQKLIIKPGRYFGEVKCYFTLAIEIISLLLAVFTTQCIRQESLNSSSNGRTYRDSLVSCFTNCTCKLYER